MLRLQGVPHGPGGVHLATSQRASKTRLFLLQVRSCLVDPGVVYIGSLTLLQEDQVDLLSGQPAAATSASRGSTSLLQPPLRNVHASEGRRTLKRFPSDTVPKVVSPNRTFNCLCPP